MIADAQLTIRGSDLWARSGNWKFDIEMHSVYDHGNYGREGGVNIDFSNLRVTLDPYFVEAAGTRVHFEAAEIAVYPFLLTVEFTNPVVKININAQKVLVTRVENLDVPKAISMRAKGVSDWVIYRVVGNALP